MTLTQVQHGTCVDSAETSGFLYVVQGAGPLHASEVRCSRGCEDVPTMAELYANLEDRDALVEHFDGGLYVETRD